MGTRADFYVKKEKQMQWLGSKAFDGYPEGISKKVLESKTEVEFRENMDLFFKENDDVTLPENGWPWPWNDSNTTDYAYIFENDKVMGSCFGGSLFDPLEENEEDEETNKNPKPEFPDMTDIKNVAWSNKKSGLIIISDNKQNI